MSDPAPSSVVAALRAAGCVFAEEEARLIDSTADTPGELAAMVDRRVAGLPLEQVLGWAEFCGLRVTLDPGVFAPRRRTELLARRALAWARPGAVVVDLCCGSGAVGAVVAAATDGVDLHAVDVDPAAVRCARVNLPRARVYEGDLYGPLPAALHARVDVLVANVPYVPTDAIALLPREARLYEPRLALDGGADGLHVQRRVIAAAPEWLAADGHLLLETSEEQLPETVATMQRAGLVAEVARSAELEATVAIAARPAG